MIRVGLGFDAHPFNERRPFILGGIEILGSPGLSGHSDADVLSHAVADALLGAANLGDLGALFPNDERWHGASSLLILSETADAVGAAGWSIVNVDATVVAEVPRLNPYRDRMIGNVSEALRVDQENVSIKATTTDHLGFVGRGEGIAAIAVVLIERA
ncbi:MAG: 2-C-methyl-D-erythritol 2,4-cyclodiphosphate synthase [Actinomycetota bacterium]|jgi:2-C-methyl-D-erythritol 2,4-cyclodiphosphate synthase|nr:2-C-methyl-D-erythritol 2,4-cyclodiphosphate synthase [Actinomycetota bacterium]